MDSFNGSTTSPRARTGAPANRVSKETRKEPHLAKLLTGPEAAQVSSGGTTMKNKYVRLLLLALSGASAVFGVKVMTDYNHAVDFSQYHTYSWVKVEAGDPLWPDRITHAVDSELSAKGWSMVPAGGDASVAAFGSTLSQP